MVTELQVFVLVRVTVNAPLVLVQITLTVTHTGSCNISVNALQPYSRLSQSIGRTFYGQLAILSLNKQHHQSTQGSIYIKLQSTVHTSYVQYGVV